MRTIDTFGLCEFCLAIISVKIIINLNNVIIRKKCTDQNCLGHTEYDTIISDDAAYFQSCFDLAFRNQRNKDSLFYNMVFLELSNECDIKCSTCMANAGPGLGKIRDLNICNALIKQIEKSGFTEIIMLTGGEPAIHPDIELILDTINNSSIHHCILISNGVRISQDESFLKTLSKYRNMLEIYLQFDSLSSESLIAIRGHNLKNVRIESLKNLEKYNINTTLVCVVKGNINIHEVNEIIKYALTFTCVRGVTFQPIRALGRLDNFDKLKDRVSLTDIRSKIIKNNLFVSEKDLIPHPINPLGICIGYIDKTQCPMRFVTAEIFDRTKWTSDEKAYTDFLSSMFFLPQHNTKNFVHTNLFRIMIVSYLDKYSFISEQLNCCNMGFILENNEIVPFDTHYLEGEPHNIIRH